MFHRQPPHRGAFSTRGAPCAPSHCTTVPIPGAGSTRSPGDLEAIEVVTGDVRDPHGVRAACAASMWSFTSPRSIAIPYSYESPDSYVDTNVRARSTFCKRARPADERVIVTSTSEVFGTARYVPIDEGHPRQGSRPTPHKIAPMLWPKPFNRSFELP